MPKETIHCVPTENFNEDSGVDMNGEPAFVGSEFISSEFVAEVGWRKASDEWDANVTIVTYDRTRQALRGTEQDYEAGKLVPTANLDREGINGLIRALRKARDQAFGTDA